ncbi:MAG: DUF6600 domain-containing protein, partial [Rhodanobacter sp.]
LLASIRRSGAALAIAVLLSAAGLAHAQSTTDGDSADPPSRVARLSWINGDVGLLPAGATDWSDASINRPLTTGDKLSSGDDARAELELGGATLRLAHRTDLGLLDLNEQMAQIELTQGTLNLTVRHLDDGQSYEVDTPTVALVINQPGNFRVDIDGDATRVTALEGKATVYGENNAQRDVFAGRSYRFVDSSLSNVAISDAGDSSSDSFGGWVDQRDQRYAQYQSNQYVPDNMVGAQDLDQYGEWQDNSDYGAVWYPRDVATDWAPYRDGRWAYIAPWGWTWIDSMQWGYAPYHYGRWAHTYRGWGWIPGPRYARPIYAPALVAFVSGGGFSVGIGSGPVGWFPLGPGEIYNPWYRSSRDYYRRVNVTNIRVTNNITNVTIINNINNHYGHYRDNKPLRDERYVNRHAPGGFSAMPSGKFASGDRVQRNLVKLDQRQLAAAKVIPRGVDVRPLPGSRAGQRSAHVRQLPVNGFQREVVARHAPPAVGERRIGPTNNLAGPRQAVMRKSNVRVLDGHPGVAGNQRPATDDGTGVRREGSRLPRTSNVIPNAPIVQRRVEPTGQPRNDKPTNNDGTDVRREGLRLPRTSNVIPNAPIVQRRVEPTGQPRNDKPTNNDGTDVRREGSRLPRTSNVIPNAPIVQRRVEPTRQSGNDDLPSARFAHPSGRNQAEPRTSMPRPGVSYISGANQDSRRSTQREGTLPQVPRIQPESPITRPEAVNNTRSQRYPISPARSDVDRRDSPQPRFQQPAPAERHQVPEEVRTPAAVRREPPQREMQQPVMQQPRYQQQPRYEQPVRQEQPRFVQPQRTAPPPRAEAPRVQRSEPHEERQPDPRKQKDEQQH